MLNLFRGGRTYGCGGRGRTIGIRDNDWVEAINANGATVARAVVSQRIPRGMAMYHAQEERERPARTRPASAAASSNRSRVIVKPTNMVGGYAQLAYGFNYYGTVGCQRDEVVVIHKIEDQDIDWLASAHARTRSFNATPWHRQEVSADSRPEIQEKQMKIRAQFARWCSTSTSASAATPAR